MKTIHNVLLLAILLAFAAPFADAQIPDEDMDRYINEIRAYKHEYLARELDLSRDTQREFFPVYDAMEDTLIQVNAETRALERAVIENPDATDTEIDAAIVAIYGQKAREARIEETYLRQIAEILTPRQLVQLRAAERRFNQQLVRRSRRGRQPR